MGQKASEALDISQEELPTYLRMNHSAYMDLDGSTYYLTDVNESYWRVQDTSKKNEKDHFVDCSELVPTVNDFLGLPFTEESESINDVFERATFFASIKPED